MITFMHWYIVVQCIYLDGNEKDGLVRDIISFVLLDQEAIQDLHTVVMRMNIMNQINFETGGDEIISLVDRKKHRFV